MSPTHLIIRYLEFPQHVLGLLYTDGARPILVKLMEHALDLLSPGDAGSYDILIVFLSSFHGSESSCIYINKVDLGKGVTFSMSGHLYNQQNLCKIICQNSTR